MIEESKTYYEPSPLTRNTVGAMDQAHTHRSRCIDDVSCIARVRVKKREREREGRREKEQEVLRSEVKKDSTVVN